jgi:hypothetical protein
VFRKNIGYVGIIRGFFQLSIKRGHGCFRTSLHYFFITVLFCSYPLGRGGRIVSVGRSK